VHGAADGLAGVAVDRFADVLVVHAGERSPGDARGGTGVAIDALVAALVELVRPRAVYVKGRPRRPGRAGPAERAAAAPAAPAWGEPAEAVVVLEHGVRYEVRPAAGLSVGLFLDMREVRAWVREHARARRVLNLFSYTCAFGVCAGLGRAARVLNLDASRPYLRWGRANYALNGLPVEERDFVYGDALDWLGRLARRGERFELVIVDPPSFGSTRVGGSFSVERDYGRLVGAAAHVTAAGGILLAATNHGGVSVARFDELVGRGLAAAGRLGRRVGRWHEPARDFPVPPHGRPYLKIQAVELD
jgi:23S rRNA (cytosine1962-C5)-methyltransferase